LITESKRDAHFAVSFWQSKNNAPIEESLNQKENIIENNKEESFIKKWVKKIF